MITRRTFLGGLAALVGGIALEEAIPFHRVWSFPKKIVIANVAPSLQAFRYAYRDLRTGEISPSVITLTNYWEASLVRGMIASGKTFNDGTMVPVEI